jgi:hypothetical protein
MSIQNNNQDQETISAGDLAKAVDALSALVKNMPSDTREALGGLQDKNPADLEEDLNMRDDYKRKEEEEDKKDRDMAKSIRQVEERSGTNSLNISGWLRDTMKSVQAHSASVADSVNYTSERVGDVEKALVAHSNLEHRRYAPMAEAIGQLTKSVQSLRSELNSVRKSQATVPQAHLGPNVQAQPYAQFVPQQSVQKSMPGQPPVHSGAPYADASSGQYNFTQVMDAMEGLLRKGMIDADEISTFETSYQSHGVGTLKPDTQAKIQQFISKAFNN